MAHRHQPHAPRYNGDYEENGDGGEADTVSGVAFAPPGYFGAMIRAPQAKAPAASGIGPESEMGRGVAFMAKPARRGTAGLGKARLGAARQGKVGRNGGWRSHQGCRLPASRRRRA
jgi:hypothetical protein